MYIFKLPSLRSPLYPFPPFMKTDFVCRDQSSGRQSANYSGFNQSKTEFSHFLELLGWLVVDNVTIIYVFDKNLFVGQLDSTILASMGSALL